MSRKNLDTREKILREAYIEFQKNGYKLANVDRIVKKAGVTKGALYYYFKSKKELANSVIDTVIKDQLDKIFLNNISLDPDKSLAESLLQFRSGITIEEIKHGGTLVRLANELSDNNRGTQNRIKKLLDEMMERVADKLNQDQALGKLSISHNTSMFSRLISSSIIGSLTIAKVYQDKKIFKELIGQLVQILETIYEKK